MPIVFLMKESKSKSQVPTKKKFACLDRLNTAAAIAAKIYRMHLAANVIWTCFFVVVVRRFHCSGCCCSLYANATEGDGARGMHWSERARFSPEVFSICFEMLKNAGNWKLKRRTFISPKYRTFALSFWYKKYTHIQIQSYLNPVCNIHTIVVFNLLRLLVSFFVPFFGCCTIFTCPKHMCSLFIQCKELKETAAAAGNRGRERNGRKWNLWVWYKNCIGPIKQMCIFCLAEFCKCAYGSENFLFLFIYTSYAPRMYLCACSLCSALYITLQCIRRKKKIWRSWGAYGWGIGTANF